MVDSAFEDEIDREFPSKDAEIEYLRHRIGIIRNSRNTAALRADLDAARQNIEWQEQQRRVLGQGIVDLKREMRLDFIEAAASYKAFTTSLADACEAAIIEDRRQRGESQ